MGINCSFHGFLTADAEQRTSASGGSWARLRAEVGTHRMQGVRITVLGEGVLAALRLKRGDKVRGCPRVAELAGLRRADRRDAILLARLARAGIANRS